MAYRRRGQQSYDHRLWELVRRTGDIRMAIDLGIPRSTAAGWLRGDLRPVVTLESLGVTNGESQAEILKLRRRVRILATVVRLLLAVVRVSGTCPGEAYVRDRQARATLLHAIGRARSVLPASSVLKIVRISASRYNSWVRAERGCRIEEHTSCPRSTPNQLTPEEIFAIGQMVAAEQYRHVPTGRR